MATYWGGTFDQFGNSYEMNFSHLYVSRVSSAVIGAGTDYHGDFKLKGVRDGNFVIGLYKDYVNDPRYHLVYEGELFEDKTVFIGTWELWWTDRKGHETDKFELRKDVVM